MSEKVSDSINFLIAEYQRLIKKKIQETLSNSVKETLKNLKKFLGKN